MFRQKLFLFLVLLGLVVFMPVLSWACACGCGVFDVGTSAMLPSGSGGMFFLDYDYMNQNHNWSGTSKAAAQNNDDKRLRTDFMTAGVQYMFNRRWGIKVELPYNDRYFKTTDDDTGDIVAYSHAATGDLRIQGIYTGFSPDMSTGLTFGVKLPTGDWTYPGFDRDSAIGSGSTDILLGGFHRGALTPNGEFNWFLQDSLDQPVMIQGGYRPGTEDDAALGLYYTGLSVFGVKMVPVAQALGSLRSRDRGWAAEPTDSGYERVLLSPGLELDFHRIKVYGDVEFPVYQRVNGNQLVAPELFKVVVSYSF